MIKKTTMEYIKLFTTSYLCFTVVKHTNEVTENIYTFQVFSKFYLYYQTKI